MCNTQNNNNTQNTTDQVKSKSDLRLEALIKKMHRIKAEKGKQKKKKNKPTLFNGMFEFVELFNTEEKCLKYFEAIRWKDGKHCAYCKSQNFSQVEDTHNYFCFDCAKTFNVKSRTIFEVGKTDLREFFMSIYLENSFVGGLTTGELERQSPYCRKKMNSVINLIRQYGYNQNCFATHVITESGTNIYMLDTMARDGEERNRQIHRKQSYRGGTDRQYILVIMQKDGNARAYNIDNVRSETMTPIITKHIPAGSDLYTDEAPTFKKLGEIYKHQTVNHKAREFGREGVSTNAVEGWNSFFQTGLAKFRNSISLLNTDLFVNAAIFRFNTRYMNESEKLDLVLENVCTYLVDTEEIRKGSKRTTFIAREKIRKEKEQAHKLIVLNKKLEREEKAKQIEKKKAVKAVNKLINKAIKPKKKTSKQSKAVSKKIKTTAPTTHTQNKTTAPTTRKKNKITAPTTRKKNKITAPTTRKVVSKVKTKLAII